MGSEFQKDGSTKIDPDPFALTSMVLAAAAVVLQFITVVQQRPRSNEDTIEPGAARSLMQPEEEVEKLEAEIGRASL